VSDMNEPLIRYDVTVTVARTAVTFPIQRHLPSELSKRHRAGVPAS